jgi:glucose-6-phosphate isomerase
LPPLKKEKRKRMNWLTRARCDQTPTWQQLAAHYQSSGKNFDVRTAFHADAERFAKHNLSAAGLLVDMSKNLIDSSTQQLLNQLARDCNLEAHRDAMLSGHAINHTEGRAVGHVFLRGFKPKQPLAGVNSAQIATNFVAELAELEPALNKLLAFVQSVRANEQITDVVNIGIGGSDLGPAMACAALEVLQHPRLRMHFVSNVDGHDLAAVLRKVKAQSTLFIIASKTFTTIETIQNATSARDWALREAPGLDVSQHFVGVTTNLEAAAKFGIQTTFGFWDWVGGRYSMWSAIGLPIAIAVGADNFKAMLAGAHAMDEHFASAPIERNLPVQLGLLDVWYRNFHGFTSRSVAPYHQGLRRFPAYLQQLEMESNGKRVDGQGRALPFATSPVVWGEPGTNGQHAFFQMLHQGTDVIPVEFIAVKNADHALPGHQNKTLANALAQAQALMQGKSDEGGHKHFTGNRPSTFMVLPRLDAYHFGALVALYEHRVFVSGSLWGINSFDQFGVELGKVLAKDIEPRLSNGDATGLDGSTAALLAHLRA